jgi:HK97 family phage prohead protease
MEHKSIPFELKDLNFGSRSAIIAHAVYNNIDRVGDISTKGMFNKSWAEKKKIDFLFNHDTKQIPGNVLRTFEDDEKAYTEVKFGNWTLGDDMIAMIDSGVIRGASFGYITEKKETVELKGKKVRKLKEVWHEETSLLTAHPANPLAGVVSLTKSEDIQNALLEFKETISNMEKFCNDTKASDDTILYVLNEIKAAKDIIAKYDTAATLDEPDASRNDDSFKRQLLLFNMQLS